MSRYSLIHLSDDALLHDLAALVARDRSTTAELLAHIAEVDQRRLYRPAGYDSMFTYCVGELRLCEQAAAKRIFAARAARRFPAIFAAVAEGRLHLSAVVMLAPHLTEGNADELIAAATHQSKSGIQRLIAERFPQTEVLGWVTPIPPISAPVLPAQHSPGNVEVQRSPCQLSPGTVGGRSKVEPLSSESFEVTYTMSRRAYDLLSTAQALLGVPSREVAQVVERALELLVPRLERRKFAATSNPRPSRRTSRNPRYIQAPVKRAVWARDQGRCTFVSETGHRCEATKALQFDHVLEVARGGEATVEGLRLRCGPHNQYAAECTFGTEFMRRKREAAAAARAAARVERAAAGKRAAFLRREREEATARARAVVEQPHVQEVIPYLRALGCRMDEARRAAERCADMPDASLHDRVHRAVSGLGRGRTCRASA